MPRQSTGDVARLFLRLGATAFGGPAAHIGIMEQELVRNRRWLSHEEFLDLLGATNLIPGPNSTEMAIHVGWRCAGWPGLVAAGVCFISPAVLLVFLASWIYITYGQLPEVSQVLSGIQPVVIAVIAQAVWRLGRTAIKNVPLAVIGILGCALNAAGVHELIVLFGAGAIMLIHQARPGRASLYSVAGTTGLLSWVPAAVSAAVAPVSLTTLGLVFLKVGALLFGSGYVLVAFLRADLVQRLGWISEQQLLDAIAVGQITPGPLFASATFIGCLVAGFWGGLIATAAIFLPAFIFVAISGRFIPRIRKSPAASAFLDGVNVGAVALMAMVVLNLSRTVLIDGTNTLIFGGALLLLVLTRTNVFWLFVAGALIGWIFSA